VEAYALFDEDGTPQKKGYEAAMSAFHNAIQVRRDLQYNAHFEIDDAQRMQQRRGLQDCLATMMETSDNHEDSIRSRALSTQWKEVAKALDAFSKGWRKSYSKDLFESIKQRGERKETQIAIERGERKEKPSALNLLPLQHVQRDVGSGEGGDAGVATTKRAATGKQGPKVVASRKRVVQAYSSEDEGSAFDKHPGQVARLAAPASAAGLGGEIEKGAHGGGREDAGPHRGASALARRGGYRSGGSVGSAVAKRGREAGSDPEDHVDSLLSMKLRRRPEVVPEDMPRAIAVKVDEGAAGFEPPVTEWDVERVKKLFGHCEFPTEGVVKGKVDG
jgi:hypothetical protein